MKILEQNKVTKGGLSLIEFLVAMAVFSAVMLAIIEVSLSVVSTQRKAFGIQNIQESGRFVLESMSREIKTGEFNSIAPDGKMLSITTYAGDINYWFDDTNHQLLRSQGGGVFVPVSPDNLDVDGFFLNAGSSDNPVVTIVMRLVSKEAKSIEKSKIYVQTTAVPRI